MSRVAVLLAVVSLLVAPAIAASQGGPLAPLPPAPQEPTPAPAPPNPSPNTDDDGLAAWQQGMILLAAVALLGGIAWAIVRDARRSAPAQERSHPAGETSRVSARERERRQRRSRERAKAARRQRKRNRAR